jgi:hypothetical protein
MHIEPEEIFYLASALDDTSITLIGTHEKWATMISLNLMTVYGS